MVVVSRCRLWAAPVAALHPVSGAGPEVLDMESRIVPSSLCALGRRPARSSPENGESPAVVRGFPELSTWPLEWRRRELNPRPRSHVRRLLRACPALCISPFARHAGGVAKGQPDELSPRSAQADLPGVILLSDSASSRRRLRVPRLRPSFR